MTRRSDTSPAPVVEPQGEASATPARAPVYLLAGQVHAASTPTVITTILGSCVAVCLFDPEAQVGGMNHFLLPLPVSRERSARFGNVATEELLEAVLRMGAARPRLRAKIFGGAAVLGTRPAGRRSLGEANAQLALGQLDDLGIPVRDGDVGGARGRKLIFHTDDGAAWMRLL